MDNKKQNEKSKFLSYVLRHEPQSIGLHLDSDGWVDINLLIGGAFKKGIIINRKDIESIISNNDKKRFSLSEDGRKIRALQGHSTSTVSIKYEKKKPPAVLYHGTASRFLDSIMQEGLISVKRHHVHLSQSKEVSREVGKRYGNPIILKIESLKMHFQGFDFFQSENDIWLTAKVPADFISLINQ